MCCWVLCGGSLRTLSGLRRSSSKEEILGAAGLCWGQAPTDCKPNPLNVHEAKYPCIFPDNRVMYRVNAPNAQAVRGKAEMKAGAGAITVDYGRPSLKGRDMLSQLQDGASWRMGMPLSCPRRTWSRS